MQKQYTETAYRKGIQKQHTIMTHRCHRCSDKIGKTDESGELDMVWHETYPAHCQPDMKQIREFVDSPYWEQLCSYLQKTYVTSPSIEYSRCSMQTGWNVKYKKGSRAICTLYPDEGYFICMVSIGAKEAAEAELVMKGCSPYLQGLYEKTVPFNGGRWLMIEVRDKETLEDVKEMIGVRMRKKK